MIVAQYEHRKFILCNMIERNLAKMLEKAAEQSLAVTVTGPRQSENTTLVRATFPDDDHIPLEAFGKIS